jgi:serine/threonine-protein kinase RsbW
MLAQLPRFEMQLPSNPQSIAIVDNLVEQLSDEMNLGEEMLGNIMVSLTEAVNNAILHGNKLDEKKMVELKMDMENDVLQFTVHDQGPGFAYDAVPDPTEEANLEKSEGRGIFLIRHLADEVTFKDNGATIEIKFHLKK